MISIKELENLPDEIQKEVLQYAEHLVEKRRIVGRKGKAKKWTDVRGRGATKGESASDTVIRLRREERC